MASMLSPNNEGYTQLRINREGFLILMRYDSKEAKAPARYKNCKILFDSRKYFKEVFYNK